MKKNPAPLSRSNLVVGLCLVLSPVVTAALPLIDDFNDGNDVGWTRYEPLVSFGTGGSWTFPSGGYRIQAPTPSPDPSVLGPARVGSLRNDETITDAVVSWDVVSWNPSLAYQTFGGLARISAAGLGTSNGYALTYTASDNTLNLLLLKNEAFTVLKDGPITLDVAKDYRFVFTLNGTALHGQVFDLTDLVHPLVTVSSIDATYASGVTGLIVADNSGLGTETADATFDNFKISTPVLLLKDFTYDPATGASEVSIVGMAGAKYKLVAAPDLDFSMSDPVPVLGTTVGAKVGDQVATDANGNATAQFNLGTGQPRNFIRAETP